MSMKRIKRLLENQSRLTNAVIGLAGVVFVLLAIIFEIAEIYQNIGLSIGCSLIATSIATRLTSYYIINNNSIKEMIIEWKLRGIFKSKAEMNVNSNQYLDEAATNIDIIAVGMTNFLSYKGDLLEKKALNGVNIRIISCNSEAMLNQREKDETICGNGEVIGALKRDVIDLSNWVETVLKKGGSIKIKYISTYPGFSYLRIDDNVFFGPNLPLYKSQSNFALEFDLSGEGGKYFARYFDYLWKTKEICSENLRFK